MDDSGLCTLPSCDRSISRMVRERSGVVLSSRFMIITVIRERGDFSGVVFIVIRECCDCSGDS